jgi:hypothetical protein
MQVVFSMKIYFQCKEFSKKNLKVNSLKWIIDFIFS